MPRLRPDTAKKKKKATVPVFMRVIVKKVVIGITTLEQGEEVPSALKGYDEGPDTLRAAVQRAHLGRGEPSAKN